MIIANEDYLPLFIPSYPRFRDMLRMSKTEKGCQAILLPPLTEGYVCRDGVLYKDGVPQDTDQLRQLMAQGGAIPDPILVNGIFSFFYYKGDIRNRISMECSRKEFWNFLGRKEGGNAYRLQEVLSGYESVVGWVYGKGVFPLLKVEHLPGDRVRLSSEYFHHALNALLSACSPEDVEEPRRYRVTTMHRSVLLHRNKFAALVSLEFARLMESSGQIKSQIAIRSLLSCIPALGKALTDESKSISFRNRKLGEVLTAATEIIGDHSELPRRYPDMFIQLPDRPSVKNLDAIVTLWRKNLQAAGKGGERN